jgi:hypothetical protein
MVSLEARRLHAPSSITCVLNVIEALLSSPHDSQQSDDENDTAEDAEVQRISRITRVSQRAALRTPPLPDPSLATEPSALGCVPPSAASEAQPPCRHRSPPPRASQQSAAYSDEHKLRFGTLGISGGKSLTRVVTAKPYDSQLLHRCTPPRERVDQVDSHGRWKGPCLQTNPQCDPVVP